jgi:hypothetical protein
MYYATVYSETVELWAKNTNADKALQLAEENLLLTYGSKSQKYRERISSLLILKNEDLRKLGVSVELFPIRI